MLYNMQELQEIAIAALKGRSHEEYLKTGIAELAKWATGDRWKLFGPYYPIAKDLLSKYHPESSAKNWPDAPDYLEHYNYGSNVLNWVAALAYLNRQGEYINHPDYAHSIVLADGSEALFQPGIGIIEG